MKYSKPCLKHGKKKSRESSVRPGMQKLGRVMMSIRGCLRCILIDHEVGLSEVIRKKSVVGGQKWQRREYGVRGEVSRVCKDQVEKGYRRLDGVRTTIQRPRALGLSLKLLMSAGSEGYAPGLVGLADLELRVLGGQTYETSIWRMSLGPGARNVADAGLNTIE